MKDKLFEELAADDLFAGSRSMPQTWGKRVRAWLAVAEKHFLQTPVVIDAIKEEIARVNVDEHKRARATGSTRAGSQFVKKHQPKGYTLILDFAIIQKLQDLSLFNGKDSTKIAHKQEAIAFVSYAQAFISEHALQAEKLVRGLDYFPYGSSTKPAFIAAIEELRDCLYRMQYAIDSWIETIQDDNTKDLNTIKPPVEISLVDHAIKKFISGINGCDISRIVAYVFKCINESSENIDKHYDEVKKIQSAIRLQQENANALELLKLDAQLKVQHQAIEQASVELRQKLSDIEQSLDLLGNLIYRCGERQFAHEFLVVGHASIAIKNLIAMEAPMASISATRAIATLLGGLFGTHPYFAQPHNLRAGSVIYDQIDQLSKYLGFPYIQSRLQVEDNPQLESLIDKLSKSVGDIGNVVRQETEKLEGRVGIHKTYQEGVGRNSQSLKTTKDATFYPSAAPQMDNYSTLMNWISQGISSIPIAGTRLVNADLKNELVTQVFTHGLDRSINYVVDYVKRDFSNWERSEQVPTPNVALVNPSAWADSIGILLSAFEHFPVFWDGQNTHPLSNILVAAIKSGEDFQKYVQDIKTNPKVFETLINRYQDSVIAVICAAYQVVLGPDPNPVQAAEAGVVVDPGDITSVLKKVEFLKLVPRFGLEIQQTSASAAADLANRHSVANTGIPTDGPNDTDRAFFIQRVADAVRHTADHGRLDNAFNGNGSNEFHNGARSARLDLAPTYQDHTNIAWGTLTGKWNTAIGAATTWRTNYTNLEAVYDRLRTGYTTLRSDYENLRTAEGGLATLRSQENVVEKIKTLLTRAMRVEIPRAARAALPPNHELTREYLVSQDRNTLNTRFNIVGVVRDDQRILQEALICMTTNYKMLSVFIALGFPEEYMKNPLLNAQLKMLWTEENFTKRVTENHGAREGETENAFVIMCMQSQLLRDIKVFKEFLLAKVYDMCALKDAKKKETIPAHPLVEQGLEALQNFRMCYANSLAEYAMPTERPGSPVMYMYNASYRTIRVCETVANQPFRRPGLEKEGTFTADVRTSMDILPAGLQRIPVLGDGSCLYHAIGRAIYETERDLEKNSLDLRRGVVEYIRKQINEEHDVELLERLQGILGNRSMDDYLYAVENTNEWGDHFEVEILSKVHNRPIIVIDSNGAVQDPTVLGNPGDPIFLYFEHVHYDALTVVDGWSREKVRAEIINKNDKQAQDMPKKKAGVNP